MELYTLHVMPMLAGSEDALAKDAEMLLAQKICSHIACSMTLVPERTPAADKAAVYQERYGIFKSHFKGDHSKVGILLQATVGHGWIPDEPVDFQKIITADGVEQYRMCPRDERFLAYLDDQVGKLSALKPAFFMVDDDFRMETGHTGCMCPLCMQEIAARTGKNYTREELVTAMKLDGELAEIYADVCLDSLTAAAKVIRRAIDRNAPGTPCSYCTCIGDMRNTAVIGKILAAPEQRAVIRINNARYNCSEMRTFPVRMYHGAAQLAALDKDTVVLAETDTCPQTRYSTAAKLMHSHYTGSIVEGCRGAKHWITKMNNFMPEAGVKFREILAENAAFYQTLADTLEGAVPEYFSMALLSGTPVKHNIAENNVFNCCSRENWVDFAANMGLPAHFSTASAGLPVMIAGNDVDFLSDEDIIAAAASGLILDGSAAVKLTGRGLSAFAGVKAVPYSGPGVSGESWKDKLISPAAGYALLEAEDDDSRTVSELLHRSFALDTDLKVLAPALVFAHNKAGGRSAVFAGNVTAGINFQRFSWLDMCRKEELVEAMQFVSGKDIAYIEGDDEVYFKSFLLKDGSHLLVVFSLAFDQLDEVKLHLPFKIADVQRLMADGSWRKAVFAGSILPEKVECGSPAVFRVN